MVNLYERKFVFYFLIKFHNSPFMMKEHNEEKTECKENDLHAISSSNNYLLILRFFTEAQTGKNKYTFFFQIDFFNKEKTKTK